jgi:hypothetical protein
VASQARIRQVASYGGKEVRTYRTYVDTYGTYADLRSQVGSRVIAAHIAPKRSTLPKDEARRRYVELAELAVLEQIEEDSRRLDREALAVGPFARLDANALAARDGKTRGAITNLFGSQAALQAETMALVLDAAQLIESIEYPDPEDHVGAEEWVDAFFTAQSARGPQHAAEPALDYAMLWALWLAAVPYGIWSERVSRPSMDEHVQWIAQLEQVLERALDHFSLALREGTTVGDLAYAVASLVEGSWLNQCLTAQHPTEPSEPIATALRRSGLLLWRGATEPRSG